MNSRIVRVSSVKRIQGPALMIQLFWLTTTLRGYGFVKRHSTSPSREFKVASALQTPKSEWICEKTASLQPHCTRFFLQGRRFFKYIKVNLNAGGVAYF